MHGAHGDPGSSVLFAVSQRCLPDGRLSNLWQTAYQAKDYHMRDRKRLLSPGKWLTSLGFYLVHLVYLCEQQGLKVWFNKDEGDESDVSQKQKRFQDWFYPLLSAPICGRVPTLSL